MDAVMEVGNRGLHALLQLLLHPFYYVGILFIVLQYRRQIALERKLFSTRLHSLLSETWRTVLWGLIGGVFASVVMAAVGATLEPNAILVLWLISMVLLLIKVRFLCWAYAVGAIGILQAVTLGLAPLGNHAALSWIADALRHISMPALLALVAVLHLVEAIYVRRQGTRFGTPMFYESKRGKIVGGYHLQGFWPVTLFLLVPLQGAGNALPWTPLLGGDLWQSGWTIIGFPVMIGFAEMTMSRLPRDKVRISSNLLLLYAVALLAMAWLAALWPIFIVPACVLCILLHEAIIWYSRWDETARIPFFVHGSKGLKILGILPGSAAEELGLLVGETVHKVNGVPVRSKQELHQAMQSNSAFCKLEIINLAGESKFVKRAMFSGEHHQLGIILAPDQEALYYAKAAQPSIFAYLRSRVQGVPGKKPSSKSM
ncbi:PDZ domain-containing protein [Paenibacillus allorhizosphaerae]|uniref:Cell division topological determinant MinJ n=1 Tax=Paenibacillus allorhizosphaerae TaxID=2849866 RepID=A0ABN7TXC4_9BACL|nr:PDZ domain-containing protein [Paenibacillus allorhizosphaerae]CAG7656097.1 Cell division topological determinant MinJ [Paenibacillus allorhizosphaerae]